MLTGAGGCFSAGVDLKRIVDGGPPYVAEFLPALSTAVPALFDHPRPVVAAVNGHALAGGLPPGVWGIAPQKTTAGRRV